jgi:lipoyl-dependent peroxiredoxin
LKVIYTATGMAVGGRSGRAESSDGELKITLVRPKELGGPGTGGTNPEQLFACGYAACFATTLDFLSRQKQLKLQKNEVTAHIGLAQRAEGGFGLTARLEIFISGIERSEAEVLVGQAHQACPYSNAISGNVDVDIVLNLDG